MISADFPPDVSGGAELQCLTISRELVKRGHRVVVLTSRREQQTSKFEVIDGVEVIRFKVRRSPNFLGKHMLGSFVWALQTLFWVTKHRRKVAIIHCHQAKFNAFVGLLASRVSRVALVVKAGNSGKGFDLRSLRRKWPFGPLFARALVNSEAHFVAISRSIACDFTDVGVRPQRVVLIRNGVEIPELGNNCNRGEDLGSDPIRLIYLGRLASPKAVQELLSGVALMHKRDQCKIKLDLVGDGADREKLERFVVDNLLGNIVRFIGFSSNPSSALEQADVMVLPSYSEGLSNSLLEGMARGKPPIASELSGTKDLISHGKNGWLVPTNDPTHWKDALEMIVRVSPQNLRIVAENAHHTVKSQCSVETVVDELLDLYRDSGVELSFSKTLETQKLSN